jgi:hypothetical protein
MLTPIEELAQSFHTDKNLMKLPPCVYNTSSQVKLLKYLMNRCGKNNGSIIKEY